MLNTLLLTDEELAILRNMLVAVEVQRHAEMMFWRTRSKTEPEALTIRQLRDFAQLDHSNAEHIQHATEPAVQAARVAEIGGLPGFHTEY